MLHVNTTEQDEQRRQKQEQFPQPSLVASVTEDDEEDDAHAALVQDVQASRGANREALAYLLRYETMIRQQEAEDMATLAHVRPCIERLEALAGIAAKPQRVQSFSRRTVMESDSALLNREISFRHLKRALEALEIQEASSHQETAAANSNNSFSSPEFMTTDRQLMMVLRLLTQKVDPSPANEHDDDDDDDVSIAWAEFFQAYKVCIVGMLTLQHLPSSSAIRARARDRTLAMLSLFEAPSTKLFWNTEPVDSKALTLESRRKGAASHMANSMPLTNINSTNRKRKTRRAFVLAAVSIAITLVLLGIIATRFGMSFQQVFSSMPTSSESFLRSSAFASQQQDPSIATSSSAFSPLQQLSEQISDTFTASSTISPGMISSSSPTRSNTKAKPLTPKKPKPAKPHNRVFHSLPQVDLTKSRKDKVSTNPTTDTTSSSSSIGQRLTAAAATPSLVGGLAGLAVAPWAVPQVFATGLTALHVAMSAVFGAGLLSVASIAVGGLMALFRRLKN